MRLNTIPGWKNLKKWVQIGPKFKRKLDTQECHSALPKCRLAQMCGSARQLPNWDKAYLLRFFRDKDTFQFVYDHLANFSKHFNLYK